MSRGCWLMGPGMGQGEGGPAGHPLWAAVQVQTGKVRCGLGVAGGRALRVSMGRLEWWTWKAWGQ